MEITILGPNGLPFVNNDLATNLVPTITTNQVVTTNNQSKEDNMQTTNTTSHRYEVRYHLITLHKGNLYRAWLDETNKVQVKTIKDLRYTLYAVLSDSLNKGVQPYFISFNKLQARLNLIEKVREINKEDEASWFIEFVNSTNFRVWNRLMEGTKAHLASLANLTADLETATEVADVSAVEGIDAFNEWLIS
jgi:hypothetical protein